jgi:hypothetical protein
VRSVVTENILLGTQLWSSATDFFSSAFQNVFMDVSVTVCHGARFVTQSTLSSLGSVAFLSLSVGTRARCPLEALTIGLGGPNVILVTHLQSVLLLFLQEVLFRFQLFSVFDLAQTLWAPSSLPPFSFFLFS